MKNVFLLCLILIIALYENKVHTIRALHNAHSVHIQSDNNGSIFTDLEPRPTYAEGSTCPDGSQCQWNNMGGDGKGYCTS